MKDMIALVILGLVLALGLFGTTVAYAEMKALFYEFEQSEQWFFKLTEQTVPKASGENIKYELTQDAEKGLKLANLKKFDMVLFGTHGIGGWGVYHLEGVEEDLIKYVEGGGFIFVPTSDDNFYKGDMFPEELLMRESGDHEFEVTPEGVKIGIFDNPNKVKDVIEDDSYQDVKKPWTILANSKDSGTPHTLLLNHGVGEYLVTSCRGEAKNQAEPNIPFIENVINYFVKRIKEVRPVHPAEKLATHWGTIKSK